MTPRLRSLPPDGLLNVAEAAAVTGRSRSTIARFVASGRIPGAFRDEAGAWRIPSQALADAGLGVPDEPDPIAPSPSPSPAAADEAALRAELAAWRRRAEIAEALAAERAMALDDLRTELRLRYPGGFDPFDAFWAAVPEKPRRRRLRLWRRRAGPSPH